MPEVYIQYKSLSVRHEFLYQVLKSGAQHLDGGHIVGLLLVSRDQGELSTVWSAVIVFALGVHARSERCERATVCPGGAAKALCLA